MRPPWLFSFAVPPWGLSRPAWRPPRLPVCARNGERRLLLRDAVFGVEGAAGQSVVRRNTGLAREYWRRAVRTGDVVVDATSGNGHDTLALAQLSGAPVAGTLLAMDLQPEAVLTTWRRLHDAFGDHVLWRRTGDGLRLRVRGVSRDAPNGGFECRLACGSHEAFDWLWRDPEDGDEDDLQQDRRLGHRIAMQGVSCVVYNLGYLPGSGSDRQVTTTPASTVRSLEAASALIRPDGGVLSVSCYTGHEGGAGEERAVFEWAQRLDSRQWTSLAHQWLNRHKAPSLVIIERQ
ncbi:hypothetical protein CDCA_CDCA06G1844 [Cyanidium caldarium]|uniref:rRNA methylase n=1 Tax=Cyanidium caldarium TaxID=2771 RepID=A0AAV9IUK8_CYACA|nr:hypothetical protein CDCA_CDCA06G1844 [Cyanidium caldarium]